jgi:hypothetical protein
MYFDSFPIVVLSVIFGSVIGIIFVVMLFQYLNRRSRYQTIERLVEKGQTLTPEMLEGLTNGNGKGQANRSPMSSGIFLMCIGVALTIFFWATTDFQDLLHGGAMPTAIGVIPFMVGFARVLGAVFDRREPKP